MQTFAKFFRPVWPLKRTTILSANSSLHIPIDMLFTSTPYELNFGGQLHQEPKAGYPLSGISRATFLFLKLNSFPLYSAQKLREQEWKSSLSYLLCLLPSIYLQILSSLFS